MEARIEAEVERAMGPLEGVVPPEVEEELRRLLRLALDTDPEAQRMLRASLPRPEMVESDKVDIRMFQAAAAGLNGAGRAHGEERARANGRGAVKPRRPQ